MSDERWLQLRRRRKIELYLCLIVVMPMVYGLWFNLIFLIRYTTLLFALQYSRLSMSCSNFSMIKETKKETRVSK